MRSIPSSDGFSGSLPILETTNEALRKLYWWGVLGVIWFRRDNPASVLGRTLRHADAALLADHDVHLGLQPLAR